MCFLPINKRTKPQKSNKNFVCLFDNNDRNISIFDWQKMPVVLVIIIIKNQTQQENMIK